jgi:hypothetical protein
MTDEMNPPLPLGILLIAFPLLGGGLAVLAFLSGGWRRNLLCPIYGLAAFVAAAFYWPALYTAWFGECVNVPKVVEACFFHNHPPVWISLTD